MMSCRLDFITQRLSGLVLIKSGKNSKFGTLKIEALLINGYDGGRKMIFLGFVGSRWGLMMEHVWKLQRVKHGRLPRIFEIQNSKLCIRLCQASASMR